MKLISLIGALLTGSCANWHTPLHIADLPKSDLLSSEIQLLERNEDISSSNPLHNAIPPHGSRSSQRIHEMLLGGCLRGSEMTVCSENHFLNTVLTLSATLPNGTTERKTFMPPITTFLLRFIGSPPAQLYLVAEFEPDRLGLVHSYNRFTLVKQGRFCDSIATNPNHLLSFGVSKNGAKILLFSSGPSLSLDRPVDGWREFDEAEFCH